MSRRVLVLAHTGREESLKAAWEAVGVRSNGDLERWQAIGDVRAELETIAAAPHASSLSSAGGGNQPAGSPRNRSSTSSAGLSRRCV
jgi:hypothetical protein